MEIYERTLSYLKAQPTVIAWPEMKLLLEQNVKKPVIFFAELTPACASRVRVRSLAVV